MQARVLLASVLLSVAPLVAQTTQTELDARLLHQPLYLLGEWSGGRLQFDETGKLLGKSGTLPFTLSGIDVHSVKLGSKTLLLKGNRVGVAFENDAVTRIEYGVDPRSRGGAELVHIEIKNPPDGDFSKALGNIFATGLSDFSSSLPFYWKEYGQKHFTSAAATRLRNEADGGEAVNGSPSTAHTAPQEPKPLRVGGSVCRRPS